MSVKLIGFAGKAGSGKNTGANFAKIWYQKNHVMYYPLPNKGIKELAFADALKDFIHKWFDIPWGDLYHNKNKITQWKHEGKYLTVRELLQYWGTDVFRAFHPDIHALKLKRRIKDLQFTYSLVLVTDIRFLNEANTVLDLGGHVIKLMRNSTSQDTHQSETEVDKITSNIHQNVIEVDNSSNNLIEFQQQIDTIMSTIYDKTYTT